jgi:hypothetical protein
VIFFSTGKEKMDFRNDFRDAVYRQVQVEETKSAKDYINFLCKSDVSETRLYQSLFHKIKQRYEVCDGALLLPYKHHVHIPPSGFFEHWAYRKDLTPIHIADHYKPVLRGYRDHTALPSYPFKSMTSIQKMDGHFYYMGMLNPHYGHFIQEALTRFWLALSNPEMITKKTKFVFHPLTQLGPNFLDNLFESGLGAYFDAIGIKKENVVLANRAMRFERLIVPESSVAISDGNCYFGQGAREVWLHINKIMASKSKLSSGLRKLYLSRQAVKNPIQGRILLNEIEVEKYFESIGFDIVVPESLTQCEMQSLLSKAEIIAGNPGSGLQNSFFIPRSAKTLGLTCIPIMKINPGLNHQVHSDLTCGHRSFAYCSDIVNIGDKTIEWSIDINALDKVIENMLDV